MKIYEQRISVPAPKTPEGLLDYLRTAISSYVSETEQVVRTAVTRTSDTHWEVEIGTLADSTVSVADTWRSIFEYRKRSLDNQTSFNVALVVPTGIGAELGGHAGDSCAVARLFGAASDCVITHPNVVNASDINELPDNGLYVEGSILTRLLMGDVGLQPVRSNRVLTILDNHPEKELVDHAINAIGAARSTMGLRCPTTARLSEPLVMQSEYSDSGRAVGEIVGLETVLGTAEQYRGEYDAIAITSRIQVPKSYHYEYYLGGLVNPWGGVEAMLTHTLSTITGCPSAHSPMMESEEILNLNLGVVDPRMAAEVVSVTYLNSILKGLQRAPRVVWDRDMIGRSGTIWAEDISALVIPEGCIGLPTLAALEQGIPVIEVVGNKNLMANDLQELSFSHEMHFQVHGYVEAAGLVSALRSGVSVESLHRPLRRTHVYPPLTEERAAEFGDVIRLKSQ